MIVVKFGGTSLGDAARISRAVQIVRSLARTSTIRPRPVVVVVSAAAGITDRLAAAVDAADRGDAADARRHLEAVRRRYAGIMKGLSPAGGPELAPILAPAYRRLLAHENANGAACPSRRDAVLGLGELLSATAFALAARGHGWDVVFTDARELVVTDDRFGSARPDERRIAAAAGERLLPLLRHRAVVTQGFVGATPDGRPTTLGRGGSDYTASLLAAAVDADEIWIWTDVPGILTADRRVVAEGRPIRRLSFREAAELARFGAKVLHPAAIGPALARGIPVRIADSSRPSERGTLVDGTRRVTDPPVKSIAVKRGVTLMHVRAFPDVENHDFLRSLFEVLDRFGQAVDLAAISEASVSLTLDDDRHLASLFDELSKLAQVRLETTRAIVTLVGEGVRERPEVAARVLTRLGGIRVHMSSFGASDTSLSVVVHEADADEAVRRLHREFFPGARRTPRPAVSAVEP